MADPLQPMTSRQEAVQPSLWDRLVDDLPGLVAETDRLGADLAAEIGAARLRAILDGGARAVERAADLEPGLRARLHRLVERTERRRRLAESGIVVTAEVLREAVRRDIEALFNIERLEARFLLGDREAERHESPADLLRDFPQVRRSVLNYGVPAFAGRTGSDFDKKALERELKAVLAIFEPRLKPAETRVELRFGDRAGLRVDIDSVLMLVPVPERLRLSTSIDLDTGRAVTRVGDG